MALRIRFQYPTGSRLSYSIERLKDGLLYDFAASAFSASPATPTASLPEDAGIFAGRYKATLDPTPAAVFADGDYAVTIHSQPEMQANVADVVAQLSATMHGGDDATFFPDCPPAIASGTYSVAIAPLPTPMPPSPPAPLGLDR